MTVGQHDPDLLVPPLLQEVSIWADQHAATWRTQVPSHAWARREVTLGWLQQALDPAFASLGDAMERLDPNLGKTVARSRGNIDETVQKLLGRYEAALARRDGDTTARLARVRAALLPDGAPQERVLGVPGFAAQVGFAPFVRAVMAACVPFDGALRELRL